MPAPSVRIGLRAILIGVVAVCAAITTGYWALVLRGWERTDDAFVEGHLVFLSPRVAGQVALVNVVENQRVRALAEPGPALIEAMVPSIV